MSDFPKQKRTTLKRRLARRRKKFAKNLAKFNTSSRHIDLKSGLAKDRRNTLFHPAHIARINKTDFDLPNITISVVLFNSSRWIEKFLNSLINQSYPTNKITISLVDNGSTDNTIQILEKKLDAIQSIFKDVVLVRNKNVGYGRGHDVTFMRTVDDYVLVVNVDTEFTVHCIVESVRYAYNDYSNVAAWEFCQIPYEHPKYYDAITLECTWNSHACVLIRTSAYLDVGGYHTKIFMYGEDVELSARFRSRNYKIKYLPFSQIIHYSYADENEFKLLQFRGSIYATTVLRLRYGNWRDILGGAYLLDRALVFTQNTEQLRTALSAIKEAILKAPFFLAGRLLTLGQSRIIAFHDFDYEIARAGSFITVGQPKDVGMVSIIIRTMKGRSGVLLQSIASAINQTYPNIEIIVVEDRNTSQATVIDKVRQAYPNFPITYCQSDGAGRVAAGNTGLARSNGEFLMFLDDDDYLFGDHVATNINAISDVDLTYSYAWDVKTKIDDLENADYFEQEFELREYFSRDYSRERLRTENFIPIQAALFRRRLYDELGGFDPSLDMLEDWNLWVRYSLGGKFKLVPKTTSCYRTPVENEKKTARTESLDNAYAEVYEVNRRLWEKNL